MILRSALSALAMSLLLTLPALAAADTPVASKDGVTFTIEDVNVYWLSNLGANGLKDFIATMTVYQEGIKQGLRPTPAEIDAFIDDDMGRDFYDEFKQLYSEQAIRQFVEYTLITSKYETWLRDKIRREQDVSVTQAEANDFFLNNIELFHVPEGVYISIISVENQAQADAVLTRLTAGESFNTVAAEVNMDPQMRAASGELGVYHRGEGLPEPLEEAAFQLQANQYSKIIKGTNYHIVFCHQRYAEVSPAFEDVKDDLMLELVEAKIDPFYQDALNALLSTELPRFTILANLFKPEE